MLYERWVNESPRRAVYDDFASDSLHTCKVCGDPLPLDRKALCDKPECKRENTRRLVAEHRSRKSSPML
jgi:hypothetical protein